MGCGKVVSATTRWRHKKSEERKARGRHFIFRFTYELTFHTANAETLDTVFPDIATALRTQNEQDESLSDDSIPNFDGTLPMDEDFFDATQYFDVQELDAPTPEHDPHDDEFPQATPVPQFPSKATQQIISLQRTFGFTDIEVENEDGTDSRDSDEEEVVIEWDQARILEDIDTLEEELARMQMEEQLGNAQGQLLLEAESLVSSSTSLLWLKRGNLTA